MLKNKGWFVKETHGNMYQSGFPDLFACRGAMPGYPAMQRWIEIKLPDMKGSRFTNAQLRDFPLFSKNGSGVWILTGDTEYEYQKLFRPPNWTHFLFK